MIARPTIQPLIRFLGCFIPFSFSLFLSMPIDSVQDQVPVEACPPDREAAWQKNRIEARYHRPRRILAGYCQPVMNDGTRTRCEVYAACGTHQRIAAITLRHRHRLPRPAGAVEALQCAVEAVARPPGDREQRGDVPIRRAAV